MSKILIVAKFVTKVTKNKIGTPKDSLVDSKAIDKNQPAD